MKRKYNFVSEEQMLENYRFVKTIIINNLYGNSPISVQKKPTQALLDKLEEKP